METNYPPPVFFGMPEKFSEWRPHQFEACMMMGNEDPRFTMSVCPTGFGKSMVYMAQALTREGRTVILTSTKGLQTQLAEDFGELPDVTEIRGRGNYQCRLNTKVSCDAGLCVFGVRCQFRDKGGCAYFDQLSLASKSKVVITNYSYWMAQNEYSDGLGSFDCLVLDEAHAAVDHVIDHVSVQFSKRGVEGKLLDLETVVPTTLNGWTDWAKKLLPTVTDEAEAAKMERKERKLIQLLRIENKLKKLVNGMDKTWIWEEDSWSVTISPIWPTPFAEKVLFLDIEKVILTSATVVPKTADLLGIERKELDYREFPHSFPEDRRPLIHTPTVRMNYRNGEAEERIWINKLDAIIGPRLGTKGIVHTISYARCDKVIKRSKFADRMVTHKTKTTESVVRKFKASEEPMVLVSPSMITGWDFPLDECRWQVIIKLPYPDMRGNIIKKRNREDKDFVSYQVIQSLIQATGRGCRSKEDTCETFILDNNIVWFMERNGHLVVDWFNGAYRVERRIPEPLVFE